MIQTVLGPIEASKLGITMAHEHLSVDLRSVRGDEDSIFTDSPLVRSEMARLRAAGVNSVVEVSCIDMGRNVSALADISRASGLHIVCSTGFYLEKYHPTWLKDAPIAKIEGVFRQEFSEGIDGTGQNLSGPDDSSLHCTRRGRAPRKRQTDARSRPGAA